MALQTFNFWLIFRVNLLSNVLNLLYRELIAYQLLHERKRNILWIIYHFYILSYTNFGSVYGNKVQYLHITKNSLIVKLSSSFFYWLIFYYFNDAKYVLQESFRTHLHRNIIFYLNFGNKLFILIEATFSHYLLCFSFFTALIKTTCFLLISTYPKDLL